MENTTKQQRDTIARQAAAVGREMRRQSQIPGTPEHAEAQRLAHEAAVRKLTIDRALGKYGYR